MKYSNHRRK